MADIELNNLISQTDIVALVSKYVQLTKKGKNYVGLCPFHSEKTGSFYVSPEKGLATCFGCHKGGNALDFIKLIENVDTPKAIDMLYEFNGLKNEHRRTVKVDNNKKYYDILNTAKDFYKLFLNQDVSSANALEYLKKRGITNDVIDVFDIGLSPDNPDTIYKVLQKKDFLELDMFDMGLVNKNANGYYDIFRNRIMFPIKNENGDTLGFSARKYSGPDSNDKYINTTDTKIFNKGNVVFNLNLAKFEINKKHRVILHEGQMDVIASYRAGLGEAVCSLGTGLTQNQVKLLSKYTDSVIICYDGDKAGINSAVRAISLFKKMNFKIHLVLLPDGLDPDEMVKKYGASKYVEFFESNIIDDVEFQYRVILKNKNLDDRSVFDSTEKEIFNLLRSLNSSVLEEKYLARLKNDFNVSLDSIQADYSNYLSKNRIIEYQDMPFEEIKPQKKNHKKFNNLAELRIFIHAKKSKSQALRIDKEINNSLSALSKENQSLWMTLINDYYCKFDTFEEAYFVKMLSKEDMEQYLFINEKLASDSSNYDINDLEKCIAMINNLAIDDEMKMLKNQIKLETDENKKSELYNKLFALKKKRGK